MCSRTIKLEKYSRFLSRSSVLPVVNVLLHLEMEIRSLSSSRFSSSSLYYLVTSKYLEQYLRACSPRNSVLLVTGEIFQTFFYNKFITSSYECFITRKLSSLVCPPEDSVLQVLSCQIWRFRVEIESLFSKRFSIFSCCERLITLIQNWRNTPELFLLEIQYFLLRTK